MSVESYLHNRNHLIISCKICNENKPTKIIIKKNIPIIAKPTKTGRFGLERFEKAS